MHLNIFAESANMDVTGGMALTTNTSESLLKTEAFINVRVPSIDVELRSDAPNLLVPVTSTPTEVSGVIAHTRMPICRRVVYRWADRLRLCTWTPYT